MSKDYSIDKLIIRKANENDFDTLADLWEESVADTYDYLRMKEIIALKKIIKEKHFKNKNIAYYLIEDEDKEICAFSGIEDNKIEFLFVKPNCFGKGMGKELLIHALSNHDAKFVEIHQQNIHALSFYSMYGFEILETKNKDIFGNVYPVQLLELKGKTKDLVNKLRFMD